MTQLSGKDLLSKMNKGGGKKLPIAIHSKINLQDIVIEETYVDLIFEDKATGQSIHKRLFVPDVSKIKEPRKGYTVQETLQLRTEEAGYHLVDLVTKMISEDAVENLTGSDLKELARSTKTLVMPVKDTAFLNLKVISTEDGKYADISNFPGYLERFVEGQEPKLKFSPKEIKNMTQSPSDSAEPVDTSKWT